MTNAAMIFNPNAGRARSRKITEDLLVQGFRERGVEISEMYVNNIAGIESFVEALAPGSLLIMAGGDGTLYEVVQAPACRQLSLGIVPLGTENNLAMAAGIPMDIDLAVNAVANGRECVVDLGRANGGMFTQAAGVGFHAEVFRQYGRRQPRSLARAVKVVLQVLAQWQSLPMSVSVDGVRREVDAVQVTVANTPIYGKAYPIAPDACIRDGWLDVVEIPDCKPKLELAGCILDFMEGRELDPSKVRRERGRHIEIAPLSDVGIPAHADSEPIGYAPVTIEVVPACLRLRVPE